jgi:hypothetical protein
MQESERINQNEGIRKGQRLNAAKHQISKPEIDTIISV